MTDLERYTRLCDGLEELRLQFRETRPSGTPPGDMKIEMLILQLQKKLLNQVEKAKRGQTL